MKPHTADCRVIVNAMHTHHRQRISAALLWYRASFECGCCYVSVSVSVVMDARSA